MKRETSTLRSRAPDGGVHLRSTTGVRPSSGAAASDLPGTCESAETPFLSNHAAPEDGRTPVQAGLDARGTP